MSTVSDLVFNYNKHYITSKFGIRNGKQHNAVDYGTNSKKIAQYAIADGIIESCGKNANYDNALYVWIKYPSLGVKMLHYHLDRYVVKKEQIVKKGDIIGYTGDTGKTTGIHLHLGLKYLNSSSWQDVEKWSKEVYDVKFKNSNSKIIDRSKPTTTPEPQLIWEYLIVRIRNTYGVAGLMGNLYSESGLVANNLEDSKSKKLGLSDAQYTERVDNGKYTNFIKDGAGYGLAQWTYWSRKQELYDYCKKMGSIGNIYNQLDFLYQELTSDFSEVLTTLKNAKNIKEASNQVLFKFERPENQGSSVQSKRATEGQKYYDKYKHLTAEVIEKNNQETKTQDEESFLINFKISWVSIGEIED